MNHQDAYRSWEANFSHQPRHPYYAPPSSMVQMSSTAVKTTPSSGLQRPQVNVYSRPETNRGRIQGTENRGDHRRIDNQWNERPSTMSNSEVNLHLARLFLKKGIDIGGAERLGAGRYSKVVTARQHKSDGTRTIALKVINTKKVTREFAKKFLPREIACWRQLAHPHLVRILGHYEAMDYVFLAMEYGNRGDMLHFVQKNGPIVEDLARRWMTQILLGVGHMHSMRMTHRDLKLENIICFSDGNVKVILFFLFLFKKLWVADFGFARIMNSSPLSDTYCGSKSYSAPEILSGRPYNPFKSDVWSVGVIGFIMVTDMMPFRENQHNSKIVESQKLRRYSYPAKLCLSAALRNSIDQILNFEPSSRPTIQQCFRLPFFQGF